MIIKSVASVLAGWLWIGATPALATSVVPADSVPFQTQPVSAGVAPASGASSVASVSPDPGRDLSAIQSAAISALVPKPAVVDAYESAEAELHDELRKVLLGAFPCAGGAKVVVAADPRLADRYHVTLGKKRYHMHPVGTTTGVIRLEDTAEGMVWLQLANKSMLMNSKFGRRMADDCMAEPQVRMSRLLKEKPQVELLK